MRSVQQTRPPTLLPRQLESLLPLQLRERIRCCGAPRAEELRLHRDREATVTCSGRNYRTHTVLSEQEMNTVLQKMCGGSLYAYSQSISQGYVTLEGGIRVGVCGTAALSESGVIGVSSITGLMIRIPNPVSISPEPILSLLREQGRESGILIYSPPGVGKTTLLRAVARQAASPETGIRTVVVDTREELSPMLGGEELLLDVLVGYPRQLGIEIAVRTMGASLVICDEIGGMADAHAILHAANCGVPLLATAHAGDAAELLRRPSLQLLHRAGVFGSYVGISRRGGELCYTVSKREEL